MISHNDQYVYFKEETGSNPERFIDTLNALQKLSWEQVEELKYLLYTYSQPQTGYLFEVTNDRYDKS